MSTIMKTLLATIVAATLAVAGPVPAAEEPQARSVYGDCGMKVNLYSDSNCQNYLTSTTNDYNTEGDSYYWYYGGVGSYLIANDECPGAQSIGFVAYANGPGSEAGTVVNAVGHCGQFPYGNINYVSFAYFSGGGSPCGKRGLDAREC